MSTSFVEAVAIDEVRPHPNADRLEVAVVRGATVVVGKGTFQAGDHAAYFPPDTLIPNELSTRLGVQKYLKHGVYQEGEGASQCRVAGCLLRGQPSFGFLAKIDECLYYDGQSVAYALGDDIGKAIGAKKYEPPVRLTGSECSSEHPLFHKYSEIENYNRYPNAIPEGTPVRITEKIHGTNSRVGIVRVPGEDGQIVWEEMAGSHRVRRKRPVEGQTCEYWEPIFRQGVKDLLEGLRGVFLADSAVILFGEIYGPGVQDMDYGVSPGQRGYRLFDISIDGHYMPWELVEGWCSNAKYGVQAVPLLYKGPFSKDLVEKYTYGPTTIGEPRGAFKGREGIVITPLDDKLSAVLGGRMILKSVSADYLDRKGGQDNE